MKNFELHSELIRPAPWMCFRTWSSPSSETLSMLRNERHHKIATLDGASALLWREIEGSWSYEHLVAKATDLDVADEVDDFLGLLQQQFFIECGDSPDAPARAESPPAPTPKQLEDAENTAVEGSLRVSS
jgi:hypothetical protein